MEIYKEDVPVSLHNLIDIIGMDKFVEVARFYGGANLYIPMYKNLMIYDRNRKIVRERIVRCLGRSIIFLMLR